MNAYNFSERVRKVLQNARSEAVALRHEYVGTEHMLLGLCESGGVAEHTLRNLGVEPNSVREAILESVKPGPEQRPAPEQSSGLLGAIVDSIAMRRPSGDLPYTSRAKKALELSMMEAHELRHEYVGTEHLLMGLLREARGIAAQVLASKGMTLDGTRNEVLRLLGTEMPEPTPSKKRPRTVTLETPTLTVVVEHPDGRIEARKFNHVSDAVHFLNELEY